MKLRIHLAIGYLTVSLLLASVGAVSYRNAQTLMNASGWVAHTDQVLAELESVRGTFRQLYDASRATSGTSPKPTEGNQALYRSLSALLGQHLGRIRAMTEGDSGQQQLVSLLEQDVARKTAEDELRLGLRARAANEVPEKLSSAGERAQVQEIFQLLAAMRTKEEALLHERTIRANRLSESTMRMIGVISLGALVVFTLSYGLLAYSLRARERMQQNLAESEALYKDLFDGTSDLIQLVSPEGHFLYTNRAWQKALGYTAEEVSALRLDDVVHPEDLAYAKAILARLMAGEVINGIEVRVRAKNGQVLHIQGSSSCRYVKGKPFSTRGMYRDVTERTRTEMQLKLARQQLEAALAKERELARLDALTGVGNRRAFYEVLEAERSRAVRYNRPLTVAYLDLDNFKKVNDTKGHGAGDLLLTKVATRLRTSLRITDFVSRLGGDEFAVILPETNGPAAETVLEKLRTTLLEQMAAHYCEVTFSIGAVTFLNPKDSLEVMVRLADEAMYTAKTNGKNRTCLALLG